jgi:ABC-2 type transport system ATP-binding protein
MTDRDSAASSPAAGVGADRLDVEARALTKRYGDLEAVSGVSFSVRTGEVFAFLGPNGAGKTTTINMLCTLARPTSGGATVAGYDVVTQPKAVRRRIGLVFQDPTLDQQLTAEENLRFHAVLYRVPRDQVTSRIQRMLELMDLSDRGHDLVSTFSGGMARRLEIARALLHTPHLLFLDEPTIGLDPQTRVLLWENVLRLREREGVTVFLTTHYMDEAEHADRIAIIDRGRIVALDTPGNLKAAVGADTVTLETADDEAARAALAAAGFEVRPTAGGMVVMVEDGEAVVAELIAVAGVPVRHVRVHRPTLDDVFLFFTGREIREEAAEGQSAVQRAWRARRR